MAPLTPASPRLVVGNWKMNGGPERLRAAARIARALAGKPGPRVAICPPPTLLDRLATVLDGSGVMAGGQDCHAETAGAFTGEVSAEMLAEAGARLVILGHSERRHGLGEDDALVSRKTAAAVAAGLEPIVCVGETGMERQAGRAMDVVRRQLRGSLPAVLAGRAFAVAYEPVWAIGTGERASEGDVTAMHRVIRRQLHELFPGVRPAILYGGSITPESAGAILTASEVDGVLVGGASLRAESFLAIVEAARDADRPARGTRRADGG